MFTASAIIYTPLKYFIPGFGDYNYRGQIVGLSFKTDSIEHALEERALWLENFSNVINGKVDTTRPKAITKNANNKTQVDLSPASDDETQLRKDVEEEDNFALSYKLDKKESVKSELNQYHFFPPVQGYVTDEFDPKKEHFGIDIAAPENQPVKATLDGTVISSTWDIETGFVIAIQHRENIVSFYKHNSKIFKNVGSFVRAGDVIANIGNSGELSSGPHLHFELWHNGVSLNPRDYIIF
jgi:murein DD-endopeptidase MepM/ murein hydrolase activator NlpD